MVIIRLHIQVSSHERDLSAGISFVNCSSASKARSDHFDQLSQQVALNIHS
jgi:hypothetical protein